ncbi:MAG: UDP-N-acetylmuramoyl-tripeptide--D-alanyl-D-alanine ligase [Candidatus Sungbacteria bacterium]|nr:UDP-N-acetylmuramoyl-tripeptide--D-alanyl-D-alanine ligase [Candidatus Sungbacteria bacterium]
MLDKLKTLLAVFQSAHYDKSVFRPWLARHPHPQDWNGFKNLISLDWTPKARIIFLTAIPLSLGLTRLLPGAVLSSSVFVKPIEKAYQSWLTFLTRRRVRKHRPKIVVGITGSFGKTTAKEIAATILSQKFKIHKTPENVNTLLGVARWMVKEKFNLDDILIVEMGAYRRGDIRRLAKIIRPDIAVLTGINEAHFERFGGIANTQEAKCEIFDSLKKGGVGFWNKDSKLADEAVRHRLGRWLAKGVVMVPYGEEGSGNIKVKLTPGEETGSTIELSKTGEPNWRIETKIALIGRHHAQALGAALTLAEKVGMNINEIKRGLTALRPLERRLEPSYSGKNLIIDDSYNITLDGVLAAVDFLGGVRRRKIGVFAGIPEGGGEASRINRELGEKISRTFEMIILRQTPVIEDIIAGLCDGKFPEARIMRYTEKEEIKALLAGIVKEGDCIYFSAYDWPAVYL